MLQSSILIDALSSSRLERSRIEVAQLEANALGFMRQTGLALSCLIQIQWDVF
jgi:hypothetical protein